jgi:hypothetical protein
MKRLRTLKSYQIFKIKNKKIKNLRIAVDIHSKPILWYHSHADLTGWTVPLREEFSYKEAPDTEIMMQLSVQSLEFRVFTEASRIIPQYLFSL